MRSAGVLSPPLQQTFEPFNYTLFRVTPQRPSRWTSGVIQKLFPPGLKFRIPCSGPIRAHVAFGVALPPWGAPFDCSDMNVLFYKGTILLSIVYLADLGGTKPLAWFPTQMCLLAHKL